MSFLRDLKLNAAGDLDYTAGDLTFLDDTAAIIQGVSNRLQFWQGEWFLDTRQGMPYFTQIFQKGVNQTLIQSIFYNAIASSPGILSVISVNLVYDRTARVLTVNWQAQAATGVAISQSDNLVFPGSTNVPINRGALP